MFALAVCVLGGIAGAQASAAEQLSLRVGAYVAPDGSLAPAAEVTIEDGIIKSIRELNRTRDEESEDRHYGKRVASTTLTRCCAQA